MCPNEQFITKILIKKEGNNCDNPISDHNSGLEQGISRVAFKCNDLKFSYETPEWQYTPNNGYGGETSYPTTNEKIFLSGARTASGTYECKDALGTVWSTDPAGVSGF